MVPVTLDRTVLLRAYDDPLRTDAETSSALAVTRLGPLHLGTFGGGRGFVTYRDLGGASAGVIRSWVGEVVAHFRADPAVSRVEWKTRGHDTAPGLHEALLEHRFVPEEAESVMIGPAVALVVDVPLPPGVTLRRVTEADDVRATEVMAGGVFGDSRLESDAAAEELLRRLAAGDGMEVWVAEADGQIVSCGRLEPVPGTDVAGIWGGATVPEWRGRGIYRALTSARASSALAAGKTLMHSDSTEYSRPILERAGLVKVTTTTPYEWRRGGR
ncbi:MAG: GNAT family N-acetyltransferase [Phycicoccus sp.]